MKPNNLQTIKTLSYREFKKGHGMGYRRIFKRILKQSLLNEVQWLLMLIHLLDITPSENDNSQRKPSS